ncbi:hypothetical protein ILYODFUR_035306 [Ilyodon furcidens]|uniref:Secreted protein n=1 Tax=Ilyodon furcidens TaxID=33524 RepID=A0ABV0U1N7_9TELE
MSFSCRTGSPASFFLQPLTVFSFRVVLYLASSIFLSSQLASLLQLQRASPQHDATTTTMFHNGDGVFRVMCCFSVFHIGEKVKFWSNLTRAPSFTFLLCPVHSL